jgi:nicotinate-nucleotide adenylyltransferase
MAEQAREQARLDQVWFVPTASPPHKQGQPLTPFAQRVEMLQLAVAGHTSFQVEELEKDRPGPSYTADTLAELHRRYPQTELFLLIGSDSLPNLPSWHDPERVVRSAGLLVGARVRWPVAGPEELCKQLGLATSSELRIQVVDIPLIEIASRDVRRRVAQGRSIRFLVPRAVECYIGEKHLYQ